MMSDHIELARQTMLDAEWFAIQASDIQLPDGSVGRGWRWIDYKLPAVGIVPVRADGALLLVNQYRFTTRTRGWEIPAGRVEPGEPPDATAVRELREETGHRAQSWTRLGHYYPSNGTSNQEFFLFVARELEQVSGIQDTNEIDAVRWFAPQEVRGMLARNEIFNGMSVTGLLWYFLHSDAASETQ